MAAVQIEVLTALILDGSAINEAERLHTEIWAKPSLDDKPSEPETKKTNARARGDPSLSDYRMTCLAAEKPFMN